MNSQVNELLKSLSAAGYLCSPHPRLSGFMVKQKPPGSERAVTVTQAASAEVIRLQSQPIHINLRSTAERLLTLDELNRVASGSDYIRPVLNHQGRCVFVEAVVPIPCTDAQREICHRIIEEMISVSEDLALRLRVMSDALSMVPDSGVDEKKAGETSSAESTGRAFVFHPVSDQEELEALRQARRSELRQSGPLPRPSISMDTRGGITRAWSDEEGAELLAQWSDECSSLLFRYLDASDLPALRWLSGRWIINLGSERFDVCQLAAQYGSAVVTPSGVTGSATGCVHLLKDLILLAAARGISSRSGLISTALQAAPGILVLLDTIRPSGHSIRNVAERLLNSLLDSNMLRTRETDAAEGLFPTTEGLIAASIALRERWMPASL